jgi:hypothetical protein
LEIKTTSFLSCMQVIHEIKEELLNKLMRGTTGSYVRE